MCHSLNINWNVLTLGRICAISNITSYSTFLQLYLMKKLFITILMVSAAILCFGADVSSQIKWYSGTGFPSKQPISNTTVTKLGRVFGMLENGETVEVKDGFKVSVAGLRWLHLPRLHQSTGRIRIRLRQKPIRGSPETRNPVQLFQGNIRNRRSRKLHSKHPGSFLHCRRSLPTMHSR